MPTISSKWLHLLGLGALIGVVGAAAVINLNHSTGDALRVYRLAIAGTGEFTQYHGGNKSDALDAIKEIVSELNEIYEPELAIRLELIADLEQEKIIYLDAGTDPFTPGDLSAQLGENQVALDAAIGSANYDIGHVIGVPPGGSGGGLGAVAVVGQAGSKARGVSEDTTPDASDLGFIRVIAHEIGHQFGAQHTFNSNAQGFCVGNRIADNAYEPASGSTLMSYAGICDSDDLQDNADFYFHAASISQINEHIANGGGTPAYSQTTGNGVPVVDGGDDFVIPTSTPFELTANGTDPDGDTLTYCWEQLDLGVAMGIPLSDNASSPLFRSFLPTTNPARSFPRLTDLVTGTLDAGEVLPTTARSLNFRVTARDQNSGGGGVHSDDVLLTVVNTGPFAVTAPNGGENWTGGSSQTVTWDVAGTTANGINAADVDIFLSTDGGLTFPSLLATTTNDGSASVTVPNIDTTQARYKIMGRNHIFFDISGADFTITANPAADGVSVVESSGATVVTEDGIIDTFTVGLNTAPGGSVTVMATSSSEIELSLDGVAYASAVPLVFTAATTQTVFVRAIDDADAEGGQFASVSHAITASSSGSYPVSFPINSLDVRVVDNERPPVVGVDFNVNSGRPAPTQWLNQPMTTDFILAMDLTRDDGVLTDVDLRLQYGTGGNPGARSDGVSDSSVPDHAPSLDLIGDYLYGSQTLTATWEDLVPGRTYGVIVFGADDDGALDLGQTVSITGETALATFPQTLTEGLLQVNDATGSSAQTLSAYEKTVAADALGKIVVAINPTGGNGFGLAGLSIREIFSMAPGMTSDPTDVVEGGGAATYDINLNSAPNGTLTVSLEADRDTEISLDGSNFAACQTVTFSTTAKQRITVRARDDALIEGDHVSTITNTILSSSSGVYPIGMALDPTQIPVTDNDPFGPLLVVDFDDGTGATPTYWTAVSGFSSQANLPWENGSGSGIDLTFSVNGGTASGSTDPSTSTIPSHTPSLAGLDFVWLHSGLATLEMTWEDLNPDARYNVYVFALENFGGVSVDQTVTITGQGTPTVFTQLTSTNRELWVNGMPGVDSSPVELFAVPVIATGAGEIEIEIQANNGVPWICLGGLAIQESSLFPGITVNAGDGVSIAEAGTTDTYTLALDTVPAGVVEIRVLADGQTEVSLDGANFAATQTFSRSDTTLQTVTVRAIDDGTGEADPHTGQITHEVLQTQDASNYPLDLVVRKVTATIEDNAVASGTVGIQASDPAGAEPADDAQFTVSLSGGQLAPAGGLTVFYSVTGAATNGSDFAAIASSVVIPAGANGANIAIDVTNDATDELPEDLVLTLTSTSSAGFMVAAAPDNSATVIITSDEQSPYQAFLLASFNSADLLDPTKEATIWGALLDIDGDTLTTLQEFFHNLSPTSWNDDPVSSAVVTDGGVVYFEIIFRRRKDHQGVTQIIEEGESPTNSAWLTYSGFTEIITSLDAATEEVSIRYEVASLLRRFLRLKLTAP